MSRWKEKLTGQLDQDKAMNMAWKLIVFLVVIWLLKETDAVWKGFFSIAWSIFEPFVLGFIIAFVFRPLIRKAEVHHISRKLIVLLIYILIMLLFFWLMYTLIPLFFSRFGNFVNSAVSGVQWLNNAYAANAGSTSPNWLQQLLSAAVSSMTDLKNNIVPVLSSNISAALNQTLTIVTRTLFTLIVSIYICVEWEILTEDIFRISGRLNENSSVYLRAIGFQVGTYIRSILILMIVKFAEYALLYFLIGHQDWLILGVITALGLLVPYVGPMIGNTIGLITALAILPMNRFLLLLLMIVILSNVDAYIIEPMVHSHNVQISPLWALFSIYAGGIIAGAWGIMLGIPVYLSVRTVIHMHRTAKKDNAAVV